jgi:hypothetical protein
MLKMVKMGKLIVNSKMGSLQRMLLKQGVSRVCVPLGGMAVFIRE